MGGYCRVPKSRPLWEIQNHTCSGGSSSLANGYSEKHTCTHMGTCVYLVQGKGQGGVSPGSHNEHPTRENENRDTVLMAVPPWELVLTVKYI